MSERWVVEGRPIRVGLIGTGYVGKAVRLLFGRPGYEVVAWDAADGTPYPREALAACDFGIVCVSTPPLPTGAADVANVVAAVETLPIERVLLKSTVPPGTTEALARRTGKQLCFWPEYIGESDYYNPNFPSRIEEVPFAIVGGEPALRSWFVDRLIEVLGPSKRYFQCTAREAETIKYAENAFLATKVSFVNEFRRIAEAVGADWNTVREGWLLDPRIGPSHTAAFATRPGYSGKCLPKDVDAIVAASRAAGYEPALLAEVAEGNRRRLAEAEEAAAAALPDEQPEALAR